VPSVSPLAQSAAVALSPAQPAVVGVRSENVAPRCCPSPLGSRPSGREVYFGAANFRKFPLGLFCAAALLDVEVQWTVQMHGVPPAIRQLLQLPKPPEEQVTAPSS